MIDYEKLGCEGCRYCDRKAMALKEPCCTFAFQLRIDWKNGKCLTRKKVIVRKFIEPKSWGSDS